MYYLGPGFNPVNDLYLTENLKILSLGRNKIKNLTGLVSDIYLVSMSA